jgi:hypothetical protein
MFVELNEIQNRTTKLTEYGMGEHAADVATQRAMLTSFLNVARSSLEAGMPPEDLPKVVITYRKVTGTKARRQNVDYSPLPGVFFDTHIGQPCKVARNKKGEPYFTLLDANRQGTKGGYTAVKPEGILTFAFADPSTQARFLSRAREARAG